MQYPKWVQRAPDIGAVLVQNEAEEQQLLADWQSSTQVAGDQAAVAAAAAAYERAQAQLVADTKAVKKR